MPQQALVRSKIRKTKIVATIGPACDGASVLREMIRAGLAVARLNLSHGDYESHRERAELIRQIAAEESVHIAIMTDTRGIEVRTGTLHSGPVTLQSGAGFTLHGDPYPGDSTGVSLSYAQLAAEVEVGDTVLLDDAAIELVVTAVNGADILCQVLHGGELGERKGVNLPDSQLSFSALSPDFLPVLEAEIDFAQSIEADYLAASFVQSGEELEHMRQLMGKRGRSIPIIAKIENRAGVANLDAIIAAADGVMVARGDLGVELPLAEVPSTQKQLIRRTVSNGKPVITATQMLASMEGNPKPTRAEASDVANAILDGTSAVMLSAETAVGRYPVEAMRTMAEIALRSEAALKEYGYLQAIRATAADKVAEAVGQAAAKLTEQLQAAAIITLTDSGFTARLISKHRPESVIIAVTHDESVARRLALNWGVIPLLAPVADEANLASDETRTAFGVAKALELGYLQTGDTVVVTHGTRPGQGGTDLIRVISA